MRCARYRRVGPRIEDGAIVYREFESVEQLPSGWVDRQDGGTYRLKRSDDVGYFEDVVGPESLNR